MASTLTRLILLFAGLFGFAAAFYFAHVTLAAFLGVTFAALGFFVFVVVAWHVGRSS